MEAYKGTSENPGARGYDGPIPVTSRPADREASGAALRLLEAFKQVSGLPKSPTSKGPKSLDD